MKIRVIAVVSAVAALAAVVGGTYAIWHGSPRAGTVLGGDVASGSAEGSSTATPLAQLSASPSSDGTIYAGEYRNTLYDPATGISLFWENDAAVLYVGLISPGTGWVGVGFSHRVGKPGSNIIIGAVSNGAVTIQDNYGVTRQLHLPDKASSILTYGGTETNGQTTLEFAIPLAGSDAQDATLVPGQVVQVILAYQATDDSFAAVHTRYSQTQITLDP